MAGHEVPIQVRRRLSGETVQGRLLEISRRGAKLALYAGLRFAEAVDLCIDLTDLRVHVAVIAEVSWVRPTREHWLAGLCLKARLPEDTLEKFARSQIIDRRREPRYPIRLPATVRYQLSPDTHQVELRDYSKSGFCFGAKSPGHVGASLLLKVEVPGEAPLSIFARVCWQTKSEEEFLIGCETTSGDGIDLFHALAMVSAR